MGCLLVKVKAAGVNPVDTYIREGNFIKLPNLPYIPGKDGAGVVEAVGEQVSDFKVGQRVYFCTLKSTSQYGSYAEYIAVDEKVTFPLVDSLTFEEGAAIGIPYFTAYRALILNYQTWIVCYVPLGHLDVMWLVRNRLVIHWDPAVSRDLSPITLTRWLWKLIHVAYSGLSVNDCNVLHIASHQIRHLLM
ncbi:quinone oxidoreductase-like [Limulus polyphemus]|uniref:Quinone oxidoreductase-like n=1 Tax=Limulus polyphemus TaxID=6850 RepID=A0ABM1RZS4_LIMPO|nr:quinone oxidoreductase-like [Limulus polyphemus]